VTPLLFAAVISAQVQLEPVPQAVDFVLEHFPTPQKYLPETMAGGLAVFDYNNDGRPDLFFANGAVLDGSRKAKNRLYRNDGEFKFTDVTDGAGLAGTGFAFGAAAGDFDGDGHVDLFVPAWPRSQLFRNRGDGTFEDVTTKAGISSSLWPVAAAWLDYDRDGRLDLFVVNYLDWSLTKNPWCGDRARGLRVYCHPQYFRGLANSLYRNAGGGRFEDVSVRSGIAAHRGKGMSAAVGDADGDGWLDVFVSNDTEPNFLFRQRGNGTFEESALSAGAALPDTGKPVSAMGVDFRDFDNDGWPDLIVTALARETFALYRNQGRGQFAEATSSTRLAALSSPYSGWGVVMADLDNDGFKDLVTCNSHVNDRIEATAAELYLQPNTVFRNRAGRQFDVMEFGPPAAHRGCAVADLDGDGRLDIISTALGQPAGIWRNASPARRWLQIDVPLGSLVRVAGQTNVSTSSAGYSSASLGPVHFGLAGLATVDVELTLPGGRVVKRAGVTTNQRIKLP
jgi:hypothetical protein